MKIREKERLEVPHLTVFRKGDKWRISLRDRSVLDDGNWNDILEEVRNLIFQSWELLCSEWDRKYPENPVRTPSPEGEQDD